MRNPMSILSELKRRRVFRVAAAYVVAAFVLLQAADIIFPALELPPWTLKLLVVLAFLGLPVAVALAWAFDITPGGIVRAERASGGAAPAPTSAWAGRGPAAGWLGAGILVGLIAVGAFFGVRSWRGTAPGEEVSLTAVAVLPFSVRGSADSEYLGEGMVDLLAAKLDGAAGLRVIDPRALLSFLGGGAIPDPERGRTVAEHFGAGLYILGNIVEVGGRLQLSASLYGREPGGAPLASTRVEGNAEHIWELIDRLAAQLLAEQVGGERLTRLAATTTASFDALRAYLEGENALRVGNFPAAIDAYGRAIVADSAFALAHYRLAVAASWAVEGALAERALVQALRYADRLSDRDRRLLTAYHAMQQGRAAEAEATYRALVATYPEDVEAWYQLGEVVIHYNALRGRSWNEAREIFERVVAIQPNHELSIAHLVYLAFVGTDRNAADAHLAALDPTGAFHAQASALTGLLGDETERARALAALAAGPDADIFFAAWLSHAARGLHRQSIRIAALLTDRARPAALRAAGYRAIASMAAGQGQPGAAAAALAELARLDAAQEVELRAYLALLPFLGVTRDELAAIRSDVVALQHDAPGPYARPYLLGLLSARLGELDEALRHAAELERMQGAEGTGTLTADLALGVHAEIALARDDTRGALSLLEQARLEISFGSAVGSPLIVNDRERFLRAELLRRHGRLEEAVGWYTAVAETSTPFGAVARLGLAETHDQLGNRARAVEQYAHFLDMWSECEPELRPLRDAAELRLLALAGERQR